MPPTYGAGFLWHSAGWDPRAPPLCRQLSGIGRVNVDAASNLPLIDLVLNFN